MNPKRIQRKRAKGLKMPEGAVYVGRPTKWGNPFPSHAACAALHCISMRLDPADPLNVSEAAVDLYRRWITGGNVNELVAIFMDLPEDRPPLSVVVRELRGKDLACWCGLDTPCHADVLLELANQDRP